MTFRFLIALVASVVSADAAMAETSLRIPRADCANLVEHHPAPGTNYQPGVDVRGNRVAPADLPGGNFSAVVPEYVEFDVSFNPLRGKGAQRFKRSELIVGRVQFDLRTGRASLNGQPLNDPEQAELALKCQRAIQRR